MKTILKILLLLTLFTSCSNDSENPAEESLSCSFTNPVNNGIIHNNTETNISVSTSDNVKKVEFFLNGQLIGSAISKPFNYKWTPENVDGGSHNLTCIAYSETNKEVRTEINITVELKLGDIFKGGKIFYIDSSEEHGLIATTTDLTSGNSNILFLWGPHEVSGATSITDGKTNTLTMINSNCYASSPFINGYNLNGYNDWYIASQNELTILKENQNYVGGFSSNSDEARYWSSTELTVDKAFALNFRALMGTSVTKGTYAYRIRPIRQF